MRQVKHSFDDFVVGERFESPGATLTEADVIGFALTYDPQPFHIDAQAAAASPYGGLIASGFHSLALAFRMFWQTGVLDRCNLGSPGIDTLRWLRPVRPGDTLRSVGEVLEMRPSASDPGRGILKMRLRAYNQQDEEVLHFDAVMFLRREQNTKRANFN